MKGQLLKYLSSDHHYWWTASVFPGLYSLIYLYKNNFTLVNSIEQVLGLTALFIVLPAIGFLILDLVFKRWLPTKRPQLYYSFLIISTACFVSLMVFMGWRWKALVLFSVIVIGSSFFLARHYKKLVVLIVLMSVIAGLQFTFFYTTQIITQKEWVTPQDFESFEFKKKPNVYLIQPDGYASKPVLNKSPYEISNQDFYTDLSRKGFAFQHNYRSNYSSTLTSNSALFTAQHHYLNQGNNPGELYNARNIITGNNPVIKTFKNNGYTTHLLSETTYFLTNFPEVAYDQTNITAHDLSYFPFFKADLNYQKSLYATLQKNTGQPQFFFIQLLQPAHIAVTKTQSLGAAQERTNYLDKIPAVNRTLIELVEKISNADPEGIIIIAADHGGFVGFNYTLEIQEDVIEKAALKSSIYGSLLACKAPANFDSYLQDIDSSVEVFPVLFSYLSGRKPANASDNSSYLYISKGTEKGLYRYINHNGEPVTESVSTP